MADTTIKLTVSFEALVNAITDLSLKDKQRLSEMLHEQIEQEEEDRMAQDPELRAEIDQALQEYEAGDYVTFDEYLAQQRRANE